MQRQSSGRFLFLILGGVILALLVWQYMGYRTSLRTLPQGMTIAGLDVGGMQTDQVLALLEGAYVQPVELVYQEETLLLPPENVAFQFDPEGTQAAIEAATANRRNLDGFFAYLFRRPAEPVAVAPVVSFSTERLDGFLNRVAEQYDRPPQPTVPLPEALTFRIGRAGYELDVATSREQVADALLSATHRRSDLVVRVGDAPQLEAAQLEQMLHYLLDDFDGIASVFVKDLLTGEEVEINPDVAYAGTSALKIAIIVETYRVIDQPPNAELTNWLTDTLGSSSSNFKANLLLRDIIGEGDGFQGAERLTASMNYLGLVNTFMITPYDVVELPYRVVTPANSRTDLNTNPDPYMQTTARDVGLLLEMVYQCAHGGGTLPVAYPGLYTAQECQQILEIMSLNRIDSLIEAGLPAGTPLAHKHGWGPDTHADAGIVFSPATDYVLVIYLYRPQWLEWDLSNPLVTQVSTAVYNYFNPAP